MKYLVISMVLLAFLLVGNSAVWAKGQGATPGCQKAANCFPAKCFESGKSCQPGKCVKGSLCSTCGCLKQGQNCCDKK